MLAPLLSSGMVTKMLQWRSGHPSFFAGGETALQDKTVSHLVDLSVGNERGREEGGKRAG